MPTHQYYNEVYMEETVHHLTTKTIQIKKLTTNTSKYEVESYFNLKTSRDNFTYNFFYTNIYEFSGNLERMIDEGMYKRTIKMYQISCKVHYVKSFDV